MVKVCVAALTIILGQRFFDIGGTHWCSAGPEGYGPGTWYFEPHGARHDANQRVTDEDLIYFAVARPRCLTVGWHRLSQFCRGWSTLLAEAGGSNWFQTLSPVTVVFSLGAN